MTLLDEIEQFVLSGELPAGAKLDEMTLATRFGVSRTPIREALRQLASTGLVELIPNRGAFVAMLSEQELHELFIASAELEATCAHLAAISMSPMERQGLQRLHDRMGELVEPNKIHEFGEMNDAFHVLIYRGAHNHFIENVASGLRKRLSLYRRTQFRTADRLHHSYAEHDAIVRAIVSGIPDLAHAKMLRHFDQVESSVQAILENIEQDRKSLPIQASAQR